MKEKSPGIGLASNGNFALSEVALAIGRKNKQEKLPIAYSVHVTERPELAVWTIVGLNRIEITQHEDDVTARLEALRAGSDAPRRLDLLPTKPLPRSDD